MRSAKIVPAFLTICLSASCVGGGEEGLPALMEGPCEAALEAPDFVQRIGCKKDFEALSSEPLDSSIPGSRATKVVLDGDVLYFQNSKKYKVHYDFVSKNLSGNGRPPVPTLSKFNETEYFSTARRFILGSITYYEGPQVWAFEIAPYDNANKEMIARAYDAIVKATYFGPQLYFHPTSAAVEKVAATLPSRVKIKTTAELFAKIDYQPLNLATGIGRLRFVSAAQLEKGEYLSFRDIVVLDRVPNDISVTMGIITEEFQTPLSHINVLSQNRKTPNMALRKAFTNKQLRALDGKWVKLAVGPTGYTLEEKTQAEADAFWETHKPKGVEIPKMNASVTGLWDVDKIVDTSKMPLAMALKTAVPAFGGKGTHYAAMAAAKLVPMPQPAGFVIPVHYYVKFIEQNGFDKKVDALIADPAFKADPKVRDAKLKELRDQMEEAPVDPAFEAMLKQKLDTEYANTPMRFRSSSSAEDLDGFAGAGLYTSKTGDPADPKKTALRAIKKVWSSVWYFRGYEERDYRSVDQKAVGMAILAHPSFPEEEATGVALTANPFDPSGLQPGFFINVQPGDESVTLPEAGVTADQFIYHYKLRGSPIVFLEHSSFVPKGQTVLTPKQIFELGGALDKIHEFFRPAYGPTAANPNAWYGLEVDFKFDAPPGQEPKLFIKQARPHPGRGNLQP